jgi:hypothetical protein
MNKITFFTFLASLVRLSSRLQMSALDSALFEKHRALFSPEPGFTDIFHRSLSLFSQILKIYFK